MTTVTLIELLAVAMLALGTIATIRAARPCGTTSDVQQQLRETKERADRLEMSVFMQEKQLRGLLDAGAVRTEVVGDWPKPGRHLVGPDAEAAPFYYERRAHDARAARVDRARELRAPRPPYPMPDPSVEGHFFEQEASNDTSLDEQMVTYRHVVTILPPKQDGLRSRLRRAVAAFRREWRR